MDFLQEMPDQVDHQGLVLSADAKPRLKWSPQLHERFVDAVSRLGGADKATPKSVMRIMGIPGITLYHLKSHLQKYRLAKNGHMNTLHNSHEQADDNRTRQTAKIHAKGLLNTSMLEMQMEVQRKLQEQIEVQKHLQLRIEAQGKYLQSVLRKAQETLEGYSSSSMGIVAAKAELSELVSAVDTECLSSSFTGQSLIPKRGPQHADCSTDSCLTSSEPTDAKDAKRRKIETTSSYNWREETDEINPNSSCSSIGTNTSNRILHQMGHKMEFDLNR